MKKIRLLSRALFEISRYEVIVSLRGSGRILSQLKRQSVTARPNSEELEKAICDAVHLAACSYWKPVLCLQRAVCTVRLLRRHGLFTITCKTDRFSGPTVYSLSLTKRASRNWTSSTSQDS